MKLNSYEFNGKTYEFRLSHAAKKEIEELTFKNIEKMANPAMLKAYAKMQNKEATEDEKYEALAEMLPYVKTMGNADMEIDPIELGFILLKNHRKYAGITRGEFDDLEWDMEENLGYEETVMYFEEIKDKVFTVIEQMNNKKTKAINPAQN